MTYESATVDFLKLFVDEARQNYRDLILLARENTAFIEPLFSSTLFSRFSFQDRYVLFLVGFEQAIQKNRAQIFLEKDTPKKVLTNLSESEGMDDFVNACIGNKELAGIFWTQCGSYPNIVRQLKRFSFSKLYVLSFYLPAAAKRIFCDWNMQGFSGEEVFQIHTAHPELNLKDDYLPGCSAQTREGFARKEADKKEKEARAKMSASEMFDHDDREDFATAQGDRKKLLKMLQDKNYRSTFRYIEAALTEFFRFEPPATDQEFLSVLPIIVNHFTKLSDDLKQPVLDRIYSVVDWQDWVGNLEREAKLWSVCKDDEDAREWFLTKFLTEETRKNFLARQCP